MEIDFVAQVFSKKVPIETKLSYPQKSFASLISFINKYKEKKAYVVSLEEKLKNKDKRIECVYPWELYSTLVKTKKTPNA